MQNKPTKLSLNQETLRNLTADDPRKRQGVYFSPIGIQTCPECPTPPQTDTCFG
jgi:hypothetical protein